MPKSEQPNDELDAEIGEILGGLSLAPGLVKDLTQYCQRRVDESYWRGYRAGHDRGTRGKSKRELNFTRIIKTVCPICKTIQKEVKLPAKSALRKEGTK